MAVFPLIDHHVHSVLGEVRGREDFERFITESSSPAPDHCSYFDSFLGATLIRRCAPILGLPARASPEEYVARRLDLGGEEANRLLLRAAGVSTWLVDHGYRGGELVDLAALAQLADGPVCRIVRLEQEAEAVASEGARPAGYADAVSERLASVLAGPGGGVGCKSILAYRYGLDVDPAEPGPSEVREAASAWFGARSSSSLPRLSDPVLLRHLVWVGLRAGVPLQFHCGYGDSDLELHRANPALLTRLIRLAEPLGTPIMLLHCYPYHREAAYLAGVYPNVYFDIGFAVNYVGYRATEVLAEAIESVPFHKMLYSSDAFGLAELHLIGAQSFREALSAALEPLVTREARAEEDTARIAAMIGAGNARRVYGLTAAEPEALTLR